MRSYLDSTSERGLRLLDGLVVFWTVFWLTVGAATAYSIWQLAGLGDTLVQSGQALDSAGEAVARLGQIPVVGDRPEELGREVQHTAVQVVEQGHETRTNLQRLAVLLGLAVALVPVTSMAAVYLPGRLRRRRDRRDLGRALNRDPGDPTLAAYLAARAVAYLPFEQVRRTGPGLACRPEGDSVPALAEAELARLGLQRPPFRA